MRQRAGHRCEYCQLDQNDSPLAALHVEHIIAKTHGGGDELENLAQRCVQVDILRLEKGLLQKATQAPNDFARALVISPDIGQDRLDLIQVR